MKIGSLLLLLFVGQRRPLAFGHPVPLRVQLIFGYGINQHSLINARPEASTRRFTLRRDLNQGRDDTLGCTETMQALRGLFATRAEGLHFSDASVSGVLGGGWALRGISFPGLGSQPGEIMSGRD